MLTNTLYSLHCSCRDWLQNLMGMSVHNNRCVNRATCGVWCCDPLPSSFCAVYLVSTGWRRWRSVSRWPEWQEGRSLFPSSSSAEGYCPPAPAERDREEEKRHGQEQQKDYCGSESQHNLWIKGERKGEKIWEQSVECKQEISRETKVSKRKRIKGGINVRLIKTNAEGVSKRTNVSQSHSL